MRWFCKRRRRGRRRRVEERVYLYLCLCLCLCLWRGVKGNGGRGGSCLLCVSLSLSVCLCSYSDTVIYVRNVRSYSCEETTRGLLIVTPTLTFFFFFPFSTPCLPLYYPQLTPPPSFPIATSLILPSYVEFALCNTGDSPLHLYFCPIFFFFNCNLSKNVRP